MLLWPSWFQDRKEARLLGKVVIFLRPAGIVGQGRQFCHCFVTQKLCQQVAPYESHLIPGELG